MDRWEKELLRTLQLLQTPYVSEVICPYKDVLEVFKNREFKSGTTTWKYAVDENKGTIRKIRETEDIGYYM